MLLLTWTFLLNADLNAEKASLRSFRADNPAGQHFTPLREYPTPPASRNQSMGRELPVSGKKISKTRADRGFSAGSPAAPTRRSNRRSEWLRLSESS